MSGPTASPLGSWVANNYEVVAQFEDAERWSRRDGRPGGGGNSSCMPMIMPGTEWYSALAMAKL